MTGGRRTSVSVLVGCLLLLLMAPTVARADPPAVYAASVDADGTMYPGGVSRPFISADGSVIAFTGTMRLTASVPTGHFATAYVYDRRTQTIIWNSVAPAGTFGSLVDGLSADGRILLFTAYSDAAGDGGGTGLFARNLETGVTTRVSVNPDGTPIEDYTDLADPDFAALSANGRYAGFGALVPATRGGAVYAVWVRDLATGTTTILPNNDQNVGDFGGATISDDGRYAAYTGTQSDAPMTVFDMQAGAVAVRPTGLFSVDDPLAPRIAPDGSSAMFGAAASIGGSTHVYLVTIPGGELTDITPTADPDLSSRAFGTFSGDGRYVSFASQVPLTGEVPAGTWATYVYDTATHAYTMVASTVTSGGTFAADMSSAVADGGDVVAFRGEELTSPYDADTFARTFNGWTPPPATWTPLPWDATPPDVTPPTITATFSPQRTPGGWTNTPTTVSFTCDDPGVGPIPAPPDQTFAEEGSYDVTASCVDAQGNQTTGSWSLGVDLTPPQVHAVAEAATSVDGWAFDPMEVASDDLSRVSTVTCVGADGSDVPAGTELADGSYGLTCTAIDYAGNSTTGPVTVTVAEPAQRYLGQVTLGTKTRNATQNDRMVVPVTFNAVYRDTVLVAVLTGAPTGAVSCKDSQGNSYQVTASHKTATERLFICSAKVDHSLTFGDTITVRYPAFDGVSLADATVVSGLDDPGVPADVSTRTNTGTAPTTGRVAIGDVPALVIGAVSADGAFTLTPADGDRILSQVTAGHGAKQRTLTVLFQAPTGAGSYALSGTLSGSTAWVAAAEALPAVHSGPPPQ